MSSDLGPDALQRLQELFHGAAELPKEEREAWLAEQKDVAPEILAQCRAQLELADGGASRIDRLLEPTNVDNPSILERIEARGPKVMPILLRDRDESNAPVLRAGDPGKQAVEQKIDQYQVQGEIARGGVGIVLKGHDVDLGRDVAMKVLHEEHADRPDMIQRFIEEAQIGGQLQHPGIVPVYELGLQADERPYFTMKLVKGTTLASQLKERVDLTQDHRRFLSVFEQVCQTMAYAHSRHVLHRDLKPDNVMVGSFGEVQVVDWGLAKVLGRPEQSRASQAPQASVISTVRTGDTGKGSESLTGSIMGTPAYMSPEQARGEVEELDARADVFSLGAMLCEILTGKPAYQGDSSRDVLTLAANADLNPAYERLDESGADPALIAIAKQCLAPNREDRPATPRSSPNRSRRTPPDSRPEPGMQRSASQPHDARSACCSSSPRSSSPDSPPASTSGTRHRRASRNSRSATSCSRASRTRTRCVVRQHNSIPVVPAIWRTFSTPCPTNAAASNGVGSAPAPRRPTSTVGRTSRN